MHESVLLKETIESLNLKDDSIAVDMTLGFAGHSSQILKRIKNGYLFAFDQDEEALAYSKDYLNTLKDANNIKLPFFYLRGGIDYSKLNFFFRKFLPVIGKGIAKDDKELLNLFKNGGDFVTKDNLNEVLNYLK